MKNAAMNGRLAGFVAVLLVVGCAKSVRADSFYANLPGVLQVTSTSPISITTGIVTFDAFTGQASASAGPGTLGGLSQASYDYTSGTQGGGSNAAQEDSLFEMTGIHITGPTGATGIITVFFNVAVSGAIGATATPGFGSQASVSLSYGAGSSIAGTSGDLGSMTVNYTGEVSRTGIFNNFSAGTSDSALSSVPSITTFAGDTINFSLHLSTDAIVFRDFQTGPGTAYAYADFYHTAGFDPSQPVLILPDGYSAYSEDGSIVNDRFVTAGTVPEPGSLLLLTSGLLGIAGMCRHKRLAGGPRFPSESPFIEMKP